MITIILIVDIYLKEELCIYNEFFDKTNKYINIGSDIKK